jgi:hypothetical protein
MHARILISDQDDVQPQILYLETPTRLLSKDFVISRDSILGLRKLFHNHHSTKSRDELERNFYFELVPDPHKVSVLRLESELSLYYKYKVCFGRIR